MNTLKDLTITIVGIGLMGGSMAGALRGHCREVIGVDRDSDAIAAALNRGLLDHGTNDLSAGVRNADMVILATPVRVILQQLDTIGALVKPSCIIFDLGSTKARIAEKMAQMPPHHQVLGGHPMCGKETSGVSSTDPQLYRGCTFILSPLARTSETTLALGRSLVEIIGAHPLVISPQRQDYLVATISHLPYLLACALVSSADETTSQDPLVWDIVAGGYRDTSRVAASDVTMMLDILLTNRDEVLRAVQTYNSHLKTLTALLENGKEAGLRAQLTKIRQTRLEMFP